ncbi:BTB/POZ domain-containing protein [Rhizophagus irregularis DAOM 181602=DAOM 197198]|nr:BTB/POZ domain-containing protein [Rhizophagus irregularis DAOM 181602=DAOM 197198]
MVSMMKLLYFSNSASRLSPMLCRQDIYLTPRLLITTDVALIASWIDKKKEHLIILKIYLLNLILSVNCRASRDKIDGYNPLEWCRTKMVADERSRNHKKLSIRVNFEKEEIIWSKNEGPYFWLQDLYIKSSGSFINNIVGKSKQHSYEKKIIDRETFEIEEYKVFQVIDNRLSTFIFS